MITRRLVLAAVLAFLAGWGTLTVFARWKSQEPIPPSDTEPSPPSHLSREEIARHNRPDDCWLVIRGKVYDVTLYISSHPAPRRAITDYCGKESTWAFETKERGRSHSPRASQMLETYFLGEASE